MKWTTVRSIGETKFAKSSYIYLVLVPIITKIVSTVKSPLNFVIFEEQISLNFDISISWYVFYTATILIAIGQSIYILFCPKIIKDYSNFGEFDATGMSNEYLYSTYEDNKKKVDSLDNEVENIISKLNYEGPIQEQFTDSAQGIRGEDGFYYDKKSINILNPRYYSHTKELFNKLYHVSNKLYIWLSITARVFYILGISLFVLMVIYNAVYVFSYILNNN
jgi:hypothetical protein